MDRTELITQILILTGNKRSTSPILTQRLSKLLDKYEQNIRIMDNPDSEEGKRPERPDDDGEG